MMHTIPLDITLSGPDLDLIARAVVASGITDAGQVQVLAPTVSVHRPDFVLDVPAFVEQLSIVPFHLAAFRGVYPSWLTHRSKAAPPRFGFGDGHHFHGWACAFRGEGHERLVSRRWLRFGPWRLHQGPSDTSLVQFHDLDADADVAREQCVLGHKRMGASEEGGLIWSNPQLPEHAPGDYLPVRRRLRVPIYGRRLTPREMLDARTIVKLQALGPDRPLDGVTFAFADEAEGRAHLQELWLRELDCVTFVGGVETDIGADYHPDPTPPAWAR